MEYFNSRPCERGDPRERKVRILHEISIHAPARGATADSSSEWKEICISIHAPARGATTQPPHFPDCRRQFQFTPLREGRLIVQGRKFGQFDFNSRPCERGDPALSVCIGDLVLFQFTPLREGRQSATDTAHPKFLFQFTPLREGRPQRNGGAAGKSNFNSRPCERGDLCSPSAIRTLGHFNSRPCERGDAG